MRIGGIHLWSCTYRLLRIIRIQFVWKRLRVAISIYELRKCFMSVYLLLLSCWGSFSKSRESLKWSLTDMRKHKLEFRMGHDYILTIHSHIGFSPSLFKLDSSHSKYQKSIMAKDMHVWWSRIILLVFLNFHPPHLKKDMECLTN